MQNKDKCQFFNQKS